MGPIPQPASSQYRPPQLDTNPNVRKDKAAEKRKRVAPTKRFRANTKPSEAAVYPPMTIPKAPTNIKLQVQEGTPDNRPPTLEDALVHKSTPWPNAGKISENLFEERKDWLLPPNYLNNKDTTGITSPKPPIKEEPKTDEQSFANLRTDKCGWGTNCHFCKKSRKGRRLMAITKNNCNRKHCPNKRFRCPKQGAPRL